MCDSINLSVGAQPIGAEPAIAEPAIAEPAIAEPAIAEPAIAEPAIAEPAIAEPDVWLTPKASAGLLGVSDRAIRKAIAANKYRVRQVTGGRGGNGGMAYEILLSSLPERARAAYRHGEASTSPQINSKKPTAAPARPVQAKRPRPSKTPHPTLSPEERAIRAEAPRPALSHGERVLTAEAAEPAEPAAADGSVETDFETLLHRKLCNKPKSVQRALRHYYTKKYREDGEIAGGLRHIEGRKACGGRPSTLDPAIERRFIQMVTEATDETNPQTFTTRAQRKISVFHRDLEREFGHPVNQRQLYSAVKRNGLRKFLEKPDGESIKVKAPGHWPKYPVGELVQMDGVQADYIEIRDGEKWRSPLWIELYDLGSRRLLAMRSYFAESNLNSVDVFVSFLLDNEFSRGQAMYLRPDNAGGFLNLKRPMNEMNMKYARPDGFAFIDDYARAGTPKDKAHLESMHRAVHTHLEHSIKRHFAGRIDGHYKKQKKAANGGFSTVTVTRINITLAELNDSGLVEEHMKWHNGGLHRFVEEGARKLWRPDDRWAEYLASGPTFRFTEDDAEKCRLYANTKPKKAKINESGMVTFNKRQYFVENENHWSRMGKTQVAVAMVGDRLAYYKAYDNGDFLGFAVPTEAGKKSEKIEAKQAAKAGKIHSDKDWLDAVKACEGAAMNVNPDQLRQLLSDGLPYAQLHALVEEHHARYSKHKGTILPFNLFVSDARAWIDVNVPKKIAPYARGEVSDE